MFNAFKRARSSLDRQTQVKSQKTSESQKGRRAAYKAAARHAANERSRAWYEAGKSAKEFYESKY